ncbi:hypothetical protein AVEN_153257-1 [Araneus ventricosus]|uniref:Uncharacterized protein n=1 Tax=Araneus ventricosus TaxID=182803 RepID=A0A4Y2K4D6_ARAVE|nr:hypothetical protein AVEN_153257-1 [Araneus ventricosus]
MFWGFIAVVIRPAEQRVVEYRPKTHTQFQLAVGTVLSSLSTSFDLPIIYRSFSRMLRWLHKPSGFWNRVPLLCKVEPQYSLRFFVGFESPRKDGRNFIPLCRKGVVLVRDSYKRYVWALTDSWQPLFSDPDRHWSWSRRGRRTNRCACFGAVGGALTLAKLTI